MGTWQIDLLIKAKASAMLEEMRKDMSCGESKLQSVRYTRHVTPNHVWVKTKKSLGPIIRNTDDLTN